VPGLQGPRAFEELREFYGREGKLGWSGLEVWKYDLDERELLSLRGKRAVMRR